MPSTRKRTRRPRRVDTEPWMTEFLLHGRCLRPDGSRSLAPLLYRREYDGCFARTAAAELWAERREELMAAWALEHPGSRPWAWWTFTAPEPRPEGEPEVEYLARHGLLTAGEREG